VFEGHIWQFSWYDQGKPRKATVSRDSSLQFEMDFSGAQIKRIAAIMISVQ
jgi:hypothetical protein